VGVGLGVVLEDADGVGDADGLASLLGVDREAGDVGGEAAWEILDATAGEGD
jgi:hypothetical protein